MPREYPAVLHRPPPPFHWLRHGRYPPGHGMAAHSHRFWQTLLICGGGGAVHEGRTRRELQRGDVVVLAPGETHAWHSAEGIEFFDVSLRAEEEDPERKALRALVAAGHQHIRHPASARLLALAAPLDDAIARSAAIGRHLRDGLLHCYLGELAEFARAVGKGGDLGDAEAMLARVEELVARRYAEPLTLDDLAAAAHVSPKHLCRLFARHRALSPMQLVQRTRLEAAERLLAETELAVVDIAPRVGYRARAPSAAPSGAPTPWRPTTSVANPERRRPGMTMRISAHEGANTCRWSLLG